MPLTVAVHAPPPSAVAVATGVEPSSTVTVEFASAVPLTARVLLVVAVPSTGLKITGAAGATVSTLQLALAGVGSVFPAESVALTAKVCAPCASPVYVVGEVQATYAALSRLHANVDPASFEENENVADVDATVPVGPETIDVSGGVVSGWTVKTSCGLFFGLSRELKTTPSAEVPATSNV